jgi:VIT1/CCC1 family predicted Fe2+/Mn2+ transporter
LKRGAHVALGVPGSLRSYAESRIHVMTGGRALTRRWIQRAEAHKSDRGGWLRAAVLGADDGIVSTASLMLGVAAASASTPTHTVLVAGIAGLVAGAMSMAAGEYVSVSSQHDAERADIALERSELATSPDDELQELIAIYRKRGLDAALATQVAEQLSAKNRLATHLREELGLDERALARPLQAAVVSAASFASLGLLPIAALVLAPTDWRVTAVVSASLVGLAVLGALGGHLGGAPAARASLRTTAGGGFAMAITALLGHMIGVVAGG